MSEINSLDIIGPFEDAERAVSPLVSIILLVAIVIILSTVIIGFVFSFTDIVKTGSPVTTFETEQSDNGIHIVHKNGDTIDVKTLYVAYGDTYQDASDIVSINELSAGDSIGPINPNGHSEIELIWQNEDESYVLYIADHYERLKYNTPLLDKAGTIVYGGVEAIAGDGGDTSSIGVTGVEALGPSGSDITGDGSSDLPYIEGGTLGIIDSEGNSKSLVADDAPSNPDTDKTLMGVGQWQGSPTSVFYVNENHNEIWRVDGSGSTTKVATPSNGANAVIGTGDIDGDNDEELLFADGSQQVRYLEPSGTTKKLDGGGVGSNNGLGVGQPPDFDGDGTVRTVVVDGSNNVKIVGDAESDITFTSTSAKKAPATAADVDDDGSLEIVYVGSNGYLKYVDNPLGSTAVKTLTETNGDKISGDDKLGVVS